jgi:hypothetical protein
VRTQVTRHAAALAAGAVAAAVVAGLAGGGCSSEQKNTWYFAAAEVPTPRTLEGLPGDDDLDSAVQCEEDKRGKPADVRMPAAPRARQAGHPVHATIAAPTTHPIVSIVEDAEAELARREAAGRGDADPLPKKPPSVRLKFYRVKIAGCSFGGTAKLLTGMYPARPLHELFGEVPPPENFPAINPATTKPAGEGDKPKEGDTHDADAHATTVAEHDSVNGAVQIKCDLKTGGLELVPPDRRFTVMYGMNADAVADQVSTFARADATGKGLARLLLAASGAGELAVEAKEVKEMADAQVKAAKAVGDAIGKVDLTGVTTKDAANEKVHPAAQELLKALGSDVKLDVKDKTWPTKFEAALKDLREKEGK